MATLLAFVTSMLFLYLVVLGILSLMLVIPPRAPRAWVTAVLWVLTLIAVIALVVAPGVRGAVVVHPARPASAR